MLARFFIDRPVLAWVISIVIILLGAIAAGFLPIAEYPDITPPTVRVTASYPGANAQVVADTVAAPIEQVRLVCNQWGRCWRTGPRYYGYGYDGARPYYGRGYGYYGGGPYGYYGGPGVSVGGPGFGFRFGF